MRTTSALFACLVSAAACCPAAALAAQPGWYLALDGGQARFHGIEADAAQWFRIPPAVQPIEPGEGIAILGGTPTATSTNGDDHAAYRLTVGYRLDRYFALELGYVDLGRVPAAGQGTLTWGYACSPGFSCPLLVGLDTYTSQARLSARGWDVAVTGTVPLNPEWSLFARLGAFDGHTRLVATNIPAMIAGSLTIKPISTDVSRTDWTPTWGVGASWAPVKHWAIRLGWDRYAHLGDGHVIGRFSVNLLAAGIVYSF